MSILLRGVDFREKGQKYMVTICGMADTLSFMEIFRNGLSISDRHFCLQKDECPFPSWRLRCHFTSAGELQTESAEHAPLVPEMSCTFWCPWNELYFPVSKRVPAPLTWPWALMQKENTEGGGQCPQTDERLEEGWGSLLSSSSGASACLVSTVNTCGCSQLLTISVLWRKSREMGNVLTFVRGLPPRQQQDQPEGSAGLWVTHGTTEGLPEATDTNSQLRTSASDLVTALQAENRCGPSAGPSTGPCWTSSHAACPVHLQSLPTLLQINNSCTNPCHLPAAQRGSQHPQPWLLITISDTTGLAQLWGGQSPLGRDIFHDNNIFLDKDTRSQTLFPSNAQKLGHYELVHAFRISEL